MKTLWEEIKDLKAKLRKISCCGSVKGVYADNAAALAGGLKAGDLYRTGDTVKVVH